MAPVSDPRQVASTVVAVLEVPGRGPAEDRLIAWLADGRALLVLDNCEHLAAACADFCSALLAGCPEATILATSRESMGVAGEARWPLSSLTAGEAIALFEARARLALHSRALVLTPSGLEPSSLFPRPVPQTKLALLELPFIVERLAKWLRHRQPQLFVDRTFVGTCEQHF